ncbi:MAG: sugar nucleotide-binding protein, partial [Lutibacter sp.]|jgi:dTDP-4-dehydrorhamnose reductase
VVKAESEPKLVDKTNHLAVQHLAEVVKVNYCKFIHISTDYVSDGNSYMPYAEIDKPNPKSVYGSTKISRRIGNAKNKS